MFEFRIINKSLKARTGKYQTPHGMLYTPEIAFVATEGEIKRIPKEALKMLPVKLIIVNTFHTYTKNILQKIEEEGDIHDYSGFHQTVMSDSGGFQVFSLGFGKAHGIGKIASIFPGENTKEKGLLVVRDHDNLIHITDTGVMFNYDKKLLLFTPEMSIAIQERLGADIIFAFDECTSPLNSHEYTKKAMQQTHEWLLRGIQAKTRPDQALFAVIQGGAFADLRKESTKFMAKQSVPGYGIGGSLGRSKEDMRQILEWTIPLLPDEKPRHLLGIGQVRDIFESVERGVDLFDCVIPTREARHKVLYTTKGKINVRKMKTVNEVADKNCPCQMCSNNVTIEQLNHFFSVKDPKAFFYSTVHNIQFYSDLMENIRQGINSGNLEKIKKNYSAYF